MNVEMASGRARLRTISADQCRAARAMVNWSIGHLSRRAEVPVADIIAFERGRPLIRAGTLRALISAFMGGGIQFLPGDGLRLVRAGIDEANPRKA